MKPSGGALPSPSNVSRFVHGAGLPIDLEIGPGGDLFYVDLLGSVIRVQYSAAANQAPTAVAKANLTSGDAPLTVNFDGTASNDPDGEPLSYAWDLDGDGDYDDSGAAHPAWTYESPGEYAVSLKVTDALGASDTDSVTIGVGRPTITISAPTSTTTWAVGSTIQFSGSASDNLGDPIAPSGLSWALVLHHGVCPLCHDHPLQSFTGASSGSLIAPEHEYPASLELSLTATDASGLKGHQERGAAAANDDRDPAVATLWAEAGAERRHRSDAVLPHGHRGFEEYPQRSVSAEPAGQVEMGVVVRRRCPDPRCDRAFRYGDLHGHLSQVSARGHLGMPVATVVSLRD